MSTENNVVIIGKIGSTYGVQGWLKVYSFTEWSSDILGYTPWYIEEQQDQWTPINIVDGHPHGKGVVVKVTGFDNPEQARFLTGKKIGILRSQLPPLEDNEYYWKDLEGLTVINQEGKTLGIVAYLMETGSNDVLVVKGDQEYAIPYLPDDVVTRIDLPNQVIYVNWDIS
jgi:16S rRNA processing protein RimM